MRRWWLGIGLGCLWGKLDLFYGRLEFRLAPPARRLEARVEWHFQGATDRLLEWDLGDGLEIQQLEASEPIETYWRDPARRKLFLRFVQVPSGQQWVRLTYRGTPRSRGFGSYEVRPHATGWCLWTLSQPYGAPDWLFCRDGLEDKVDSLDITLITPGQLLGVANGRLKADSLDRQGWRWRHFKHRYPIATYLIALAVSNYAVVEVPVETPYHRFILRTYAYPQDTANARRLARALAPYFSWLEERLGPYPFATEDYQQVQIGWPGGMEHQTITFFGTYHIELLAHELAHQWFGDWVTCGSWQDLWLNEAFATYLGGTVYESQLPSVWPLWLKLTIKAAWRDTSNTIWVDDTLREERLFSYATTYAKGAVALHEMRGYVGEAAFWTALRRYLEVFAGGFARTTDFAQVVQPFWGREAVQLFIESWIFAPGYPRGTFTWSSPIECTLTLPRRYPARVAARATLVSGDTLRVNLALDQTSQVIRFPLPVRVWEIDPDTQSAYYQPRRVLPPPNPAAFFPNPFQEKLYLNASGIHSAKLYDQMGRLCRQIAFNGEPPFVWELGDLPVGCYILQLEGEGPTQTYKVVRSP
ncbi:MAG: M1 family aminopeptidase [Bacteroidia bacterium]